MASTVNAEAGLVHAMRCKESYLLMIPIDTSSGKREPRRLVFGWSKSERSGLSWHMPTAVATSFLLSWFHRDEIRPRSSEIYPLPFPKTLASRRLLDKTSVRSRAPPQFFTANYPSVYSLTSGVSRAHRIGEVLPVKYTAAALGPTNTS